MFCNPTDLMLFAPKHALDFLRALYTVGSLNT